MKPAIKWMVIAVSIVAYLLVSLSSLNLPGLEYDEVVFVNAALGDVDGTLVEWSVPLAGKRIPLMVMHYIGALKSYLYAPVFAIFGTSVATVRVPAVLLGLATLFLTYRLVGDMLGSRIALISLLLLATDPAFIFPIRLDWGPVALAATLKMSALWFAWRWLVLGGTGRLAMAGFLMGLGLFDKVVFIWFLAAFVVSFPVCFWSEIKPRLRRASLLAALGAFLLGCAPLIAYNALHSFRSLDGPKAARVGAREYVRYRLGLFSETLAGTAVHGVVTGLAPERLNLSLRTRVGDGRGLVSWLCRVNPVRATVNVYALLVSFLVIGALWLRRRLRMGARIPFFILLLTLVAAFIFATPQATGPHHAFMVYPFNQVLVAVALCEALRLVTTAAIVPFLLLLVGTQLIVDAEYISAFRLTGGAGKWSDAIYDLAAYARQNRDKTFLLMDWGFSSQLLALSDGKIKKFEAFVPVILAPEGRQLQVMYSYMLSFNSLLVFHSPRCETFPVLKTFQRALGEYGLRARLVKVFHERSGAPAYAVFEVVRSEIEEHLRTNGFFAAREAEAWDAKRGGAIEYRESASNHGMLGLFWGRSHSDLVTYWFTVPRAVPSTHLYIRYANEAPRERQLELSVDGKSARTLSLPGTGGPGNRLQEWALARVDLGALSPGNHEVRIQPAGDHQVVFLDYLYLADRELRVEPSGPCRCESAEAPVDTLFEVLGYQALPEVRLIVSPQVARAGETVLTLRVLNLDVPAIDVLYSFNGNLMPLVYGWPLDDKSSARVLVDSTTPKGSYWYRAIRDARDGSPTAWIAVDARVEVR